MSAQQENPWRIRGFVARRPRHPALTADGLPVTVAVQPDGDDWIEGRLKNLSRDGFQLAVPEPFPLGEEITFRLFDPESEYECTVRGTVRWSTEVAPGRHTVGCQSTEAIDWTTLGELFLRRMLDGGGTAE